MVAFVVSIEAEYLKAVIAVLLLHCHERRHLKNRHGPHQVAQRFINKTFPCLSAILNVEPSRFFRSITRPSKQEAESRTAVFPGQLRAEVADGEPCGAGTLLLFTFVALPPQPDSEDSTNAKATKTRRLNVTSFITTLIIRRSK